MFFLDKKKKVSKITCPVLGGNTCQRSNVVSAGQIESLHVKHVDVAVIEWNGVVRCMVPDLRVGVIKTHGRKEIQNYPNIEHFLTITQY